MIEFIGLVASLCLMLSGIPQVIKTIKQGNADGIAVPFLVLLLVGFSSMIYYVVQKDAGLPLTINYTVNLINYLIITYYKCCPRRIKNA